MPVFCVVCCDDSSVWDPISFADMFASKLSVAGDEWIRVNIARGESLPDMSSISGLVLSGSRFNVRDQLPWYDQLAEVVRGAAASGRIRVYGGCFGCQFACHALGGAVGYNPDGKFVLKGEFISVDTEVLKRLCNISCDSSIFQLIESHGDCVCEIPSDATPLATSTSCRYEMFIAGINNNILCCQSHPEFDLQYCVQDRILPALCENGRLTDSEQKESLASFLHFRSEDSARMLQIISEFLHS